MKPQFILEWKLFTNNIKNQVLFGLFIFLALFATFVIEPNHEPWRAIDQGSYEVEIEDAEYFIEKKDPNTNQRMFAMFMNMIDVNGRLIEAVETKDWHTVMMEEQNHYYNFVMGRYGDGGSYRDPYFYDYDEYTYISELQQSYALGYTGERYIDYQASDVELSQSIIEERTVIQTILRYMQEALPAILIILAILFAVDIVPKDKRHPSIVHNVPVSPYKNSWAKSGVVLAAYTGTLFIGFLIFAVPVALRHGFGPLNLPIPVYGWSYSLGHIWVNSTIGTMFFQAIILLYLIALIFIRGITWINLFIKNTFINLLTIPLVFISNLWHTPGKAYVYTRYNYIPATYFKIGQALTGQLNFLYLSDLISFGTGLLSLGVTLIVIEVLILISLKLTRRFKGGK